MDTYIEFLKAHLGRDEERAHRTVDSMTEPEAAHLNQMLQNVGWNAQLLLKRLQLQLRSAPPQTVKKPLLMKRGVVLAKISHRDVKPLQPGDQKPLKA